MQLNFNTFVLIDKQIKFKKNLVFVYKKLYIYIYIYTWCPILKPPREYLVRGAANPKITFTKVVGGDLHRMVTFNSTLNLTFKVI